MPASVAMPEERVPVELAPMQFQHITSIGAVGIADGRVYVTFIEDQPGDRPGTTIPVVVTKLMTDMENVPALLKQLEIAYNEWAMRHLARRAN